MTVNVWVAKGLIMLTDDNKISQAMKNIAYYAELYMQVSGDDPEFANRTSVNKKMVSLSNPPTTSPLYPVSVVSLVDFSGRGVGRSPAEYTFSIQVALIGRKSQESKMEKLISNMIKAIRVNREDLHDVKMFYVRDSIPSNFQPFVRDGDNPELLYGSVTFDFYSILG